MPRPQRFLLVDDDEAFNFLNRIILEGVAGCTVDSVLNGEAALELLDNQEDCPDVILLDLNMPGMDGFEFLNEFERHKCFGRTKIFILTSSLREEDRVNGTSYKSVAGYLFKPLSDEMVVDILEQVA